MEYIIYNVKDDGFEDLLWYTESPDEVAKSEAIKRFDDIVRDYPEIYYRLWGIDRSKPIPNKRELLNLRFISNRLYLGGNGKSNFVSGISANLQSNRHVKFREIYICINITFQIVNHCSGFSFRCNYSNILLN